MPPLPSYNISPGHCLLRGDVHSGYKLDSIVVCAASQVNCTKVSGHGPKSSELKKRSTRSVFVVRLKNRAAPEAVCILQADKRASDGYSKAGSCLCAAVMRVQAYHCKDNPATTKKPACDMV